MKITDKQLLAARRDRPDNLPIVRGRYESDSFGVNSRQPREIVAAYVPMRYDKLVGMGAQIQLEFRKKGADSDTIEIGEVAGRIPCGKEIRIALDVTLEREFKRREREVWARHFAKIDAEKRKDVPPKGFRFRKENVPGEKSYELWVCHPARGGCIEMFRCGGSYYDIRINAPKSGSHDFTVSNVSFEEAKQAARNGYWG